MRVEGLSIGSSSVLGVGLGRYFGHSYLGLNFSEDLYRARYQDGIHDLYLIRGFGSEYIHFFAGPRDSGFLLGLSLWQAEMILETKNQTGEQRETSDLQILSSVGGYSWNLTYSFSLQLSARFSMPLQAAALTTNGAQPQRSSGVGRNSFTAESGKIAAQVLVGLGLVFE